MRREGTAGTSEVARLEGFEPPTLGLEGRCSIQLSYRRVRMAMRMPATTPAAYSAGSVRRNQGARFPVCETRFARCIYRLLACGRSVATRGESSTVTNEASSRTRTLYATARGDSLATRQSFPGPVRTLRLRRPQRHRQTVRLPVSTRCELTAVRPHDRLRSSYTPTRQLRPFAPASITIVLCLRRSV